MGGGSTTTVENKDPWGPQQKWLTQAFSEANKIYQQQKQNPGYTGDFVSAPRPEEIAGYQNALNFSSGAGQNAVNNTLNTSGQMAGLGMTGANAGMGALFNQANTNQTAGNIAAASQYANNPYMSSMVDAATRDVRRQFNEETLPGIDRTAAGTGNMNSTRAGIAAGIAQRGLQDAIMDTSAQMRGNAYQQGLSQASTDNQQRLAASQALGGLGSDLSKAGLYGLGQGMDMAGKNIATTLLGSTGLQGLDQRVLDNELAKSQYASAYPWEALNRAFAIQGGQSWGSEGTSTKTENPSTLSTIGSVAGIFGNIFKCDIRVKDNIRRIGRMDNGLPLYSFVYKDDPTRICLGPMAQDVERVRPEAVLEIDGVKHVDMALLIGGETL